MIKIRLMIQAKNGNIKLGLLILKDKSRGGSHESFDPQGLSGYPHHDTEAHQYTEDETSDGTEHILPVFLIAFFASIVNSMFLFKSAPKTGTV